MPMGSVTSANGTSGSFLRLPAVTAIDPKRTLCGPTEEGRPSSLEGRCYCPEPKDNAHAHHAPFPITPYYARPRSFHVNYWGIEKLRMVRMLRRPGVFEVRPGSLPSNRSTGPYAVQKGRATLRRNHALWRQERRNWRRSSAERPRDLDHQI